LLGHQLLQGSHRRITFTCLLAVDFSLFVVVIVGFTATVIVVVVYSM
jgi:hypothetical protein